MDFTEIKRKFQERLNDYYKSQIKITPVTTNRASALGHPCLRYLVYLRTRWQDQLPPHLGRLKLYDRGREDERIIIRKLMNMGYEVVEMQRAFYDKDYNISGVIDAKIAGHEFVKPVPAEIKSLSPSNYQKLDTPGDLKNAREHYIRGYYTQIQLYLWLSSLDKQKIEEFGIFIFENKLNGELKIIPVEFDFEEVEHALKKAELVEDFLRRNELPNRVEDLSICAECSFRHICLPSEAETQGWDFETSEAVINLVKEIFELKKKIDEYDEIVKEYEALRETLKSLISEKVKEGTKEILAGDYIVKAKMVKSKRIDTSKIPPELKSQFQTESVSYRIDIVKLNE